MPERARPVRRAAVAPAVSRTLAAIFGGYALTLAFAAALAGALQHAGHWSPVDAMVAAALAAFGVYLLAALRAFAAPSARRAWGELLAVTALLAAGAAAWHGPLAR